MSAAASLPQLPANPPNPPPWDTRGSVERLLFLVRKLIDFGKQLAATFQQEPSARDLTAARLGFGTRDIALILARITQGLHRANALEARLHDMAERLARPASAQHSPRERAPSAPRQHATNAEPVDPRVANMPTPEEIADKVRRQPIGAVIADISRDLGIGPGHPLWHEIINAVTLYRGNFTALYLEAEKRLLPFSNDPSALPTMTLAEPGAPHPPDPVQPGTGPP